jgi:RNA polymerase primary sigma factor/RNA polymerase sigma factor
VAVDRKVLDDALDRNTQFGKIYEDMSSWMDVPCTSTSSLEYKLLMQNIHVLETSLAGEDMAMLERDILVHIEQLGAMKWFDASRSRTILTQTSHESDFALPRNATDFRPVTGPPEEQSDDPLVVRSGKSQERKLKRIRASEKSSRVCVKASLRKSKKSRKSSSSQFIAEWKNYPGRRRSIVREQSELLVTIKVPPHQHSHWYIVHAPRLNLFYCLFPGMCKP